MKQNYKLKAYFLLCVLTLTFAFGSRAQVNGYGFSTGTATFTPLAGGTQTSLALAVDDAISTAFPIGFNFVYGGTTYTTAQASSNGPLLFGTGRTGAAANNLATATLTERPGVAALWDDQQVTAGVTYQLSGVAPYRVLTVEWINMEWNYQSNTAVISYQVKLYETTNNIEFNYRQDATAYSPGTTGGGSIGIMGTAATDYISLQDVSASPLLSTVSSMNTLTTKPATDQLYIFAPAVPTPPTPTQDPTAPTCSAGTLLNAAGTPPVNVTWYWQTSATGTSTTTPYAGPYQVFANGTYYLRAFNSVLAQWSYTATSVVVSNMPLATAPPAPTADVNPACVSTGSTLSEAAAPVGYIYYWQGTTVNGQSTALNASSTYLASATGTYYVAAYETATQCWSSTVGIPVSINSYIPAAPTATPSYNICSGTVSQPITASAAGGASTLVLPSGAINLPISDNANTSNTLAASGIPAGATITGLMVNVNANHTFDGDIDMFLMGANGTEIELSTDNGGLGDNYTNTTFSSAGVTNITAGTAPFTGIFLPEGSFPSLYSTGNGNWTIRIFDDAGGDVGTLFDWTLSIVYSLPPATVAWYDAASSGTSLGTGSPLESVGTTVLPTTGTAGAYNFYVETNSGGCASATRTVVTVNVTEVLANLIPVDASCNGGDNGSFTLGTVQCGTAPFLYSLDGGLTFGAIPTDLTAGTYSVIMQDFILGESAPITVVIGEPAAPSALNVTNVTYFNATLGWTTTGDETSWAIIYGPAGFDPSTGGTTIPGATNTYTLDGVLTEATSYDFYVFSECGPAADTAGPFTFVTDNGFLAWDNSCTSFIDISTTGANLNTTDDSEAGLTLPWSWNFNGTTVNTLTVGNNGGVLFNTLVGNVGYDPLGNGLYPYNQDLNTPLVGGGVFWESIGTAPNRQLVIMWKDLAHYTFPAATDGSTFELIYDEATSEVYFLYQDVMMSNVAWDNGADATIAAITSNGTTTVSSNSATYLAGNSCVHFYEALCPSINSVTSTIYPDEVILDWGTGLYGETQWHIVYGLEGFDPTIPAEVIDSLTYNPNSEADIFNLEQNTTYEVIIYSDCEADNLMSEGFHYVFTTPPFCANPTAFAGGSDVDSLELTWNWSEFSSDYPVTEFNFQYGMNGQTASDYMAVGTNNADTIFDATLLAGGVYEVYIQATCSNPSLGTDTSAWVGPITIVMPLSNDTVCGAETLALATPYTFNNVGATVSVDEVNIAPPATGAQTTTGWANSTLNNTTWFKFVAPASGSVRINNTATNYNGQLAVYDVADCGDFNSSFLLVNANDNEIGGTSVAPNFTVCGLTPGSTYYILHDGSGTTGNYSVMITEIVLEAGLAEPLTQICTGEVMDLFTTISGNDASGVWSAPIAAANASITGSTFNSAGLGYQVFNFQYRMSDGCAYDSIVSQVQIFGLSSAGDDGVLTVCKNEPINLYAGLDGNVDHGGQWYDISNNPTSSDQIASQFPGSFNFDYITGNGVCPDDTSNVVVTVLNSCDWLSLEEAVFAGVQLYPNPTSGIINIDADNVFAIEITDANGRMINSDYNTTIGTTTVDLSKVQVGVYFVTLRNEAASKVFRVVVQ